MWSLVPPASGGGRQLHVLPPASGGGQVHNGAWKVSECAPHQRAAFHLVAEVIPTSTVRHIASSRRGMLREGPAKVNRRGASIAGGPSPGQFIMFSNKQAKTGHPQQHCVRNSEMLHICHTMVLFRMCGGVVVWWWWRWWWWFCFASVVVVVVVLYHGFGSHVWWWCLARFAIQANRRLLEYSLHKEVPNIRIAFSAIIDRDPVPHGEHNKFTKILVSC